MARARKTEKDRQGPRPAGLQSPGACLSRRGVCADAFRSLSASGCHDPICAVHRRPSQHGDARTFPPISGFRSFWRRLTSRSSKSLIRSTGFFRAKSRNLLAMARKVAEDHGGTIPRDLDALTALPGVGRKTANVVLGTAFGIASGIVVDTHVKRLARRLGLSSRTTPEQIEQDLMQVVPRSGWVDLSHRLIHHGRRVCLATASSL